MQDPRDSLWLIDLSFESKLWMIHIPSFREVASEEQRGYFKEVFSLLAAESCPSRLEMCLDG